MSNALSTINTSGTMFFVDSKGVQREMAIEAAIHKGGAALRQLKDDALDSALTKASNGKYRAAAEILEGAFPSVHKAYTKLFKAQPWANKAEMASYLMAMENAEPGKSGEFNTKQKAARQLMRSLRALPAFTKDVTDVVTLEMTTA
jgi:hypothetical protein